MLVRWNIKYAEPYNKYKFTDSNVCKKRLKLIRSEECL